MRFGLIFLALLLPAVARADGYARINDREQFLNTVAGKELRMRLLGISLVVEPDGAIKGNALGWDVSGTWEWRDGYFCREMDWSGYPIPMNCQLVEAGDGAVRFTVDKGAGESAAFSIR